MKKTEIIDMKQHFRVHRSLLYFFTLAALLMSTGSLMAQCLTQGATQTSSDTPEAVGYVFYSSSRYLYNNDGSIGRIQTFNPTTCVWVWASDQTGTISNNGYMFRYRGTQDDLALVTRDGSQCTSYANESGTTGGKVYIKRTDAGGNAGEYLRYNDGWTTAKDATNATACYFAVTKHTHSEAYTAPAFTVSASTISDLGTTAATCTRTADAAYTPGYIDYVFYNGTQHLYKTDNSTSIFAAPSAETITYTWGLEGIDAQYAEINSSTGVINYKEFPPTDQTATVTLSAVSASKTMKVCASVTFLTVTTDPESVSASDMALKVGQSADAVVTLAPIPCYRHLEFSSANTAVATVDNAGKVTPVAAGTATITVKAYLYSDHTQYVQSTFLVTVKDQVADPVVTFTPSGAAGATASITCSTTDAQIHYTTDGSVPTTSSTLYESTFSVNEGATVRALAVKEGELWENSNMVSATYHDIFLATPRSAS